MAHWFGITCEGNIISLGEHDDFESAENASCSRELADYPIPNEDWGEHHPADTVYIGTREHFNAMFDKLEHEGN